MTLSKDEAAELVDDILSRTFNVLGVKAQEYVRNDDMMHNFNTGSRKTGMIRERIIEAFRLKHAISRDDLIADMERGDLPTEEYVAEKYGDIINYYILEEMSIRHKIREHERKQQRISNN